MPDDIQSVKKAIKTAREPINADKEVDVPIKELYLYPFRGIKGISVD